MKIDLTKIGAFLGIIAILGTWAVHFGDFYFKTQYRLETLEKSVLQLEKKIKKPHKRKKSNEKK